MSIAFARRYLPWAQGTLSVPQTRTLYVSAISRARTRAATDNDHSFDLDDLDEDDERHTTSFGWEIIRQQKQFHDYMRAIERDAPVLRKLRQEFIPPTNDTPIVVRTITYGGEEMPVLRKRVLVAPVTKLPLNGPKAIHNFKIIAGVHWTIEPPKDSGVGKDEPKDQHGYIKISSENFPEPNQNLKWVNDVLEKMIHGANTLDFTDLPLDTRHIEGRIRNQRKGGHSLLNERRRITLADFPKEWLPKPSSDDQNTLPLA